MTATNLSTAAGDDGAAAGPAAISSSQPPEHGNPSTTTTTTNNTLSKNRSNKKQQQENNDDGDHHITRGPRVVKKADRILITGCADYDQCDNKVISARYTLLSFFPLAILQQFRRFANVYFLVVGLIMVLGTYTDFFKSGISPWTTLGPLAVVISISLIVEANSDLKRHRNDAETNNAKCVILQRADEIDNLEVGSAGKAERDENIMGGKDIIVNVNKTFVLPNGRSTSNLADSAHNNSNGAAPTTSTKTQEEVVNVAIAFQKLKRKDIRQGHFVLVKNREMVPADIVLLASSNDAGCAYIETSSIDGETNLKLRMSPQLPKSVVKALRDGKPNNMDSIKEEEANASDDDDTPKIETIDAATKRLTRFSALGRPDGISALLHPSVHNRNKSAIAAAEEEKEKNNKKMMNRLRNAGGAAAAIAIGPFGGEESPDEHAHTRYIAALISEPPNPSVHTFSGKLTLPPVNENGPCTEIPLGAENVLLRGAVIRNTEWVIGLAFFTGNDTKLVQNSYATPSKFSQLDVLMNKTVIVVLLVLILIIAQLATSSIIVNTNEFNTLYYAGFNANSTEPWPYLPNLPPPVWKTTHQNWIQLFLMYVTLMNNFIPLSLYVTIELITWGMLWFVYTDVEMYDDTTNTRAVARNTNISDLGRIQYIFSDKTGTLTQNVMRFKRCSVDGIIFGAPIQKTRPTEANVEGNMRGVNEEENTSPFLPVRQLLVGKVALPSAERRSTDGLERMGGINTSMMGDAIESELLDKKLTFNAEMFLRVMSLCHTVVVEKDIDKKENIDSGMSTASSTSNAKSLTSMARGLFGSKPRKRTDTGSSLPMQSPLSAVAEDSVFTEEPGTVIVSSVPGSGNRARISSTSSQPPGLSQTQNDYSAKNDDGAPLGYAYQAESPDEGALVSAASSTFGFQVIARDTSGIRLRCNVPSHFQDMAITQKLKQKQISLSRLAAETSSTHIPSSDAKASADIKPYDNTNSGTTAGWNNSFGYLDNEIREETWAILAVNKFDSDRKRMSILLRSPPELGNLPVLFCKGADSSMLDPEICENYLGLQGQTTTVSSSLKPKKRLQQDEREVKALTTLSEPASELDETETDFNQDEWEVSQMLETQVHLGEFAKEGLRTLVLGMKVLSERECTEWLELYKAASTSMKKRNEMLTEVAKKIETGLHIVGATAIEDKLQHKVPETIATLEKAGIKLWVLTGDKRETAVEIGYSTHVLTPKMHLTEVPDQGKHHVRTQMAMEFIRLTKIGRLPLYQKAALDDTGSGPVRFKHKVRLWLDKAFFKIGKIERSINRFRLRMGIAFFKLFKSEERVLQREYALKASLEDEAQRLLDVERRRRVRARAEKTIRKWLQSDAGLAYRRESQQRASFNMMPPDDPDVVLASDETPVVFTRASSAKIILTDINTSGDLTTSELRQLSLAHLTATQASSRFENGEKPLVDEDTLSLDSFMPKDGSDLRGDFDRKKRTILERCFAIDRDVRKGHLRKHLSKATKERLQAIHEGVYQKPPSMQNLDLAVKPDAVRALVIEGAALKHLLGEPDFEEILFAVASNCDAVIACRVSPKQKAELVNLVRRNVRPEPITLAIGDGANDVGMIQEAHVGVGISGKEGKQAVNASDFSIAQFRFLETLVLIHGRWNFFRLSTVVMFSFYKNTVMAGLIVIFSGQTVYSGTPLFDEWVIAMLNFVAAWPIVMTGLFDRCLSKEYVRKHPEVYKATRENELITFRTLLRWICLVFIHMCIIYYFTVPQQALGGGITSAFQGLMRNNDHEWPGDGEGGDLKSVGTVTYTVMVILFAYKVLYETRSLVHGKWPAFSCDKDSEGFFSRVAYTWVGVTYLSVGFYFFSIAMYSLVGRKGAGQFSGFVDVAFYIMTTRSMSWMLIAFVPIMGMAFDVTGKVFSNMFYPTQTQIHLEIEAYQKMQRRLRGELSDSRRPRRRRVQETA